MAKEKLQYVLEAVDKFSKPMDALMGRNRRLTDELSETQELMADTSSALEMEDSLDAISAELALMTKKDERLQKTMQRSMTHTCELSDKLHQLEEEYSRTSQSHQDLSKKIIKTEKAFNQEQASVDELGGELKKLTKEYEDTGSSNKKLRKKIIKTEKALKKEQAGVNNLGGELKKLTKEYGDTGRSKDKLHRKISSTEKAFNREQMSIEQVSSTLLKHQTQIKKTTKKSQDYANTLGDLKTKLRDYGIHTKEQLIETNQKATQSYKELNKAAGNYGKYLKKIGKVGRRAHHGMNRAVLTGVGIGAASTAAGAVVSSHGMQEKSQLAKSYGLSYETYNAVDKVAQGGGLNGEHVGDLIEEFRNKRGEFEAAGEMKTYEELMAQINLTSAAFDGLNADKQLFKIIGALEKLNDVDQRASIADQLMGGEANKFLTYLDKTGLMFAQNIAHQQQFITTTNEMAEQLERQGRATRGLFSSVGEGLNVVSVAFGHELTPLINQSALDIASFVRNNGAGIRDMARSFGEGVQAIGAFYKEHESLIKGIGAGLAGFAALNTTVWALKSTFGTAFSMVSWATKKLYKFFKNSKQSRKDLLELVKSSKIAKDSFKHLSGAMGKSLEVAGKVAASIATVASSFNFASTGMKAFNLLCSTSPLGLITKAAIGLGMAGYEVYQHWDLVVKKFEDVKKGAQEVYASVGDWFDDSQADVSAWFDGVGEQFDSAVSALSQSVDLHMTQPSMQAVLPAPDNIQISIHAPQANAQDVASLVQAKFEERDLQKRRRIRQ